MRSRALRSCLIALIVTAVACKAPPVPPEIERAELQFSDLRRVGAPIHFSREYEEYERLTREAKDGFFKTQAKFVWFRKYDKSVSDFRSLLDRGDQLLARIAAFKKEETASAEVRVAVLRRRMANIQKIGLLVRDGRVARTILAKADLLAVESEAMIRKGKYEEGKQKLSRAELYVRDSTNFLLSILDRYNDPKLLAVWKEWEEETIRLSRKEGIPAIVVAKIDQTLTLYKNGRTLRTFVVSLGRNGLYDKKHAGDYATPEGRYKVSKKNPASRFYKALVIDFPNASDRLAYGLNKQNGLIPTGVGIGGWIEIHGGGNDVFTDGCISMTDREIDVLYEIVDIGTPVTIIGSRKSLKSILEQDNEH